MLAQITNYSVAAGKTTVSNRVASDRYDILTRVLHWIFAVIIIYASIAGFTLGMIKDRSLHDFISHLNISLATLLVPLFPVRLAWKFMRVNPSPPNISKKHLRLAHAVHNLMYVLIFMVLASGILMMADGYMFFNLFFIPTPYEKGPVTDFFAHIHEACATFLFALVILHLLGVINHVVIRRVNILRRMSL